MMRVRIETVGEGLHPSEVVVAIDTKEGREEMAVGRSSVRNATLGVGWPVGQSEDHFLVELPQETFRGFWRVWVAKADVVADEDKQKAWA